MGHLQISSCPLGFCRQQVLPQGVTEQLRAEGCAWHCAALTVRTWLCNVAALQAELGHPEVLFDLRFSLFFTSSRYCTICAQAAAACSQCTQSVPELLAVAELTLIWRPHLWHFPSISLL